MSKKIEFEGGLGIYYPLSEAEDFSVEVSTDGEGLSIDLVGGSSQNEALIEALKYEDAASLGVFFSKEDLKLIYQLLWEEGTIRAKPKFVWPFSFKLRKPKIELVVHHD